MSRSFPKILALAAVMPAAFPAFAQQIPERVVISAGAVPGTMIDPDKVATRTQTVTDKEIARFGTADALGALVAGAAGVSIAEAQSNALQPNLFYRGFEASPLAGNAQGIAVYGNGVRLNQPFGDTLNWDLIPDAAISRLTLQGSNPVFGLNALGGSMAVEFKNGFTYQGAEGEAGGGSFGRYKGAFQFGANDGKHSMYVAGNYLHDDGWRDFSPSKALQGFADFGWRAAATNLHLNLIGADNDLTGNGPAPVELLAARRQSVFTHPDRTLNNYGLANLYGTHQLTSALALEGNLYLSRLRQRTRNGDASEAAPCGALLCLDGDTLLDTSGIGISDFLSGGDYAQMNSTATTTTGFGGALQASLDAPVGGRMNRFLAGFAFDGGHTQFSAQSEIGELSPNRDVLASGIAIAQADQSIAPVRIASDNRYYGLYAADSLDVTEALTLNLSARYNIASIDLHDRLGASLNGSHQYSHFNPSIGAAYRIADGLTAYGGFALANRAPTPAEFSCADPSTPCSLTNFFVSDPPLKQVSAQTVDAGLRGQIQPIAGSRLSWHAGVFQTRAFNDILFAASPVIGRGFFMNAGETRRRGVETSLDWSAETWSLSLDYTFTGASFRSALVLNSPENPLADANGQISVTPGSHLPNIPEHLFKFVAGVEPLQGWSVALSARAASGVYLRGDESNLNPKTSPYFVVDLASSYAVTERVTLFATLTNLFDEDYETFGTFSPVGLVPMAEAPGATNPRSLSPAAPRAVFGGLRVKL